MKRALAMGLGALMVAGSAAPATAASHIDFSGYYRVMYMSETNTGYGRESQSFTDSYFQDRLNLDLTFSPTDEISVYWRLRGPGSYQRFGNGSKDNKSLYTHFIYGEIKQDWGNVLIGRISDDLDVYGLASLGYQPATVPIYTNVGPFDRADVVDGIRYSNGWDNGFSIMAQYGKLDNNGQDGGRIADYRLDGNLVGLLDGNLYDNVFGRRNGASDQDWDRYQVEATYAWDGGGAGLGLMYDRRAYNVSRMGSLGVLLNAGLGIDIDDLKDYGLYDGWSDVSRLDGGVLNKYESWGLNPSIMHSWGDFSVHFEGMAQWGKMHYLYDKEVVTGEGDFLHRKGEYSKSASGYGAYLDFDYNYGPGNVTLGAWWVSGSDLNDSKNKSIADIVGGNFYPLLVAYNGANTNPGENRYYGNAGNHLSAIGFANNAYANYVHDGHLGWNGVAFGNIDGSNGALGDYNPVLNPIGDYFAINDVFGVDLNLAGPDANGDPTGIFHRDVLNANGNINRTRTTSFNNGTDANHWAIALTGNHAFTDDISMHYGLAYLALNKPNYRIVKGATYDAGTGYADRNWNSLSYTTQDKDLGFEIDLGVTVQLLDNLKFTSAFGYMFNGDAYKQFKGYELVQATPGAGTLQNNDQVRGRWTDADDSYVWFNSLTFEF